MRIAVTGRDGQVARALRERAQAAGVSIVALARPELDLARPDTVLPALHAASADVVVNAAAYTAVDKAESEPDQAQLVNATGAGAVAAAAAKLGIPVIHLSTDYVFDGQLDRPYREDDATGPIGAYGRSKLAGEKAIAAAQPDDHVILRTAWVYSPFGVNFVKTMLRLAATRDEISVVADQHGSPTSALDIADAVLQVARNLLGSRDPALRGVFHLSGSGYTHWAGFAAAIFEFSAHRGGPEARVKPIATAEYPTPARRPANSRLDCAKLARVHGITLPDWRLSSEACIGRLLPQAPAAVLGMTEA
ncbi:dTDP-4-dehydrorhamnose reductase (plasmid) [Roseomonas sp. FDAARGOS_362]|uniref:dTDP-4-dehydrorhamnose reductase n=1 Tax=Roseomonas sp. FDAARGOS_362 TaxID=2018065 RepID=UPI000C197B33|nr:dTDP-4-dehydrorhamnose reductase [Roseomonas sp. FDAARGOS_362]ATR19527.1 dTDP-4-dehydrorhamnose reductase [Roseomonas sp. FDAARGOS_362]